MKNNSYNFWLALIYEIASALGSNYPTLKKYKCYNALLSKVKQNWLYWRLKNNLIMLDNNVVTSDNLESKQKKPEVLNRRNRVRKLKLAREIKKRREKRLKNN